MLDLLNIKTMNLKKLLKDNGKIIAGITAILASGGYILNHQMNKIKNKMK